MKFQIRQLFQSMHQLMHHANWPASLPEYQWPETYTSHGVAAVRWCMAGAFHAAHALGRALGLALGWARSKFLASEALPTLVIRTDGIGDALMFEPALESLARVCSPSEIHLWAPRSTCQLFEECPTITRRVSIPRGGKDGNLVYF